MRYPINRFEWALDVWLKMVGIGLPLKQGLLLMGGWCHEGHCGPWQKNRK